MRVNVTLPSGKIYRGWLIQEELVGKDKWLCRVELEGGRKVRIPSGFCTIVDEYETGELNLWKVFLVLGIFLLSCLGADSLITSFLMWGKGRE